MRRRTRDSDAGAAPQVTVFDVNGSPLQSFFAFAPTFTGGLNVAAPSIAIAIFRGDFE